MNSDVAIVNMALSRLGQTRISSLEESGLSAQLCNLFYEPTKTELLTSIGYDFKFARGRISLAADAGENLSSWEYKYTIPATVLRVLTILDPDDYSDTETLWEQEGGALYTNASPCYIKYTKTITNPTQMPQTFIEALYLKVAAKICIKVTSDQALATRLYEEASAAFIIAAAMDSGHSESADIPTTDWRA